MIGPILNMLNSSNEDVYTFTAAESYNQNENIFGSGTQNVTVSQNSTLEDLYNKYKTLEFKNLTINENVQLKPKLTTAPASGFENHEETYSIPNNFHTAIVKCSGTLTVLGAFTAQGCGGKSAKYTHHGRTKNQTLYSPVPLICFENGLYRDGEHSNTNMQYKHLNNWGYQYNEMSYYRGNGFSAESYDFFRLLEFGRNGGFLNQNMLTFLCGAGSGARRKYKKHHKWRRREIYMGGFSCGGMSTTNNVVDGCGGGFVCLYFNHLYIDGKEYGKDACNISKISANGYSVNDDGTRGGGNLIIAADTIKIGPAGTINADAEGGIRGVTIQNSIGSTFRLDRPGKGDNIRFKPSFLNNPPAMTSEQPGFRWDDSYHDYIYTTGDGSYYFDDGTGLGIPNSHLLNPYDTSCRTGGAGVVLGYKVN